VGEKETLDQVTGAVVREGRGLGRLDERGCGSSKIFCLRMSGYLFWFRMCSIVKGRV